MTDKAGHRECIGLIAGSGRFPLLFAQEAKRQGARVVAIGLKGVTDGSLSEFADEVHTFRLGQVSGPLKTLKKAGVRRVVMAGKVRHVSLFGGILPDLRAAKILAKLKDGRTDTILKAVADEFLSEGLELISSSTYLSHMMPGPGVLTRRKPTKSETADIRIGWRAAKTVSGQDIGQSVAVRDKAVIAVEAMEGTDAMLKRAGELSRSFGREPGIVLVKVAKPGQDFRFDLPVLGLDSLKAFEEARVTAVALEAGKTMLFDREDFIRKADELKMAIIAHEDGEVG
ncbi:MAG: UDP-2,3-diacylglucosamine diphosphatase LpxI [Elusimicrobiota bacterium]